jgi:type II secretory pathway pseudopilin PulG
MNKKAFSFVELIISITILVLLAIIWTAATNNIKNNSNNSRVIADLNTLKNSLITYSAEWNILPKPDWNNNFFKSNWSYINSYEDIDTFWAYWKITENTLENRYLNIIPLDPRTNQYYSYWVAKNQNEFEIAWVLYNDWQYLAKVEWNYRAESWIFSLIREYNWSNYVIDKSYNLPYNPYEKVLIATASDWNIYKEWDTITNNSWNDLIIYFSDWSSSIIEDGTNLILLELDFPKSSNLVSNVKIFLESGSIWTQATKLWEESTFDIFTVDTTASVRWTTFNISNIDNKTELLVISWIVNIIEFEKIEKQNLNSINQISSEFYKIIYSTDNNNNNSRILDSTESMNFFQKEPSLESDQLISIVSNFNDISTDWYSGEESINISNLFDERNFNEYIEKIKIINFLYEAPNPINKNVLSFNEIINDKTWNDSCYLEWIEVRNWETATWYFKKYVNPLDDCESQARKCNNWILEWNENYKYYSCWKLNNDENECEEIQWVCTNLIPWYNLVAYAPYNNFNINNTNIKEWFYESFRFYTKNDIINPIYQNNQVMYLNNNAWPPKYNNNQFNTPNNWCHQNCNLSENWFTFNKYNHIIKTIHWTESVYWVYIDNHENDSYLKYSINSLGLSWEFIIEMSVRWWALKRTWDTNYYLFDNGLSGSNIFAFRLHDGELKLYNWVPTNINLSWLIPSSYDNKFYKIQVIRSNWNTIIRILDENLNVIKSEYSTWWSNLWNNIYIWSKSNKTFQWNDIIDYVKIYKW